MEIAQVGALLLAVVFYLVPGLFGYAAVGKLLSIPRNLEQFGLLPDPLVLRAFRILPFVELAVACLLATYRAAGAVAALALLLVFTAAQSVLGERCGCFGRTKQSWLGAHATVRNLVLIAVLIAVLSEQDTLKIGVDVFAVVSIFVGMVLSFADSRVGGTDGGSGLGDRSSRRSRGTAHDPVPAAGGVAR